MEEKLKRIINHYGVIPQLKYLQSEVFELNEAIIDYEVTKVPIDKVMEVHKEKVKHITEEIADVMVMLEQFKLYYEITDEKVKNVMNQKIDRQIERIVNENN